MWADKGREFYNKDVQNLVELYFTENEEKSSVIERFNRTINKKMFKYFSANNTRKYIDVLDLLVDQYNNTIHSSIKISKIKLMIPVTYKITDYNREVIQASFYEEELQKSSQNTFRIEKILRRKWYKSLVKWLVILMPLIPWSIQKQ